MIKALGRLKNPDDATLSIEVTLTVREARELAAQAPSQWPSTQFASALLTVLHAAIDRVDRSHEG